MARSKAEKAKTHERIVRTAARRFREDGLAGVGIADLMSEAGLTVGGFYKHFESRDALVAEAVSSAFGTWQKRADAAASGGPPFSFEKLVDDYLSVRHRDDAGTGCVFSALTGELARSDEQTRALGSQQVRADLQLLAGFFPDSDKGTAEARAALVFSALVGALSLSRVVSDDKLSRRILRSVASLLKDLGG